MKQLPLPHTASPHRRVVHTNPYHDEIAGARVTYQLELVRCGKAKCRCARGNWHGPYWYGYWSAGGRTRSLYVGKKLRPAAEVANERNERKRHNAKQPTEDGARHPDAG